MEKYNSSLFIFRRDLRLDDNTALLKALELSTVVIPVFIFDPRQVDENPFKSSFAMRFMAQSLVDLQNAIEARGGKFNFCFGRPEKVAKEFIVKHQVCAVFVNRDYTPFSIQRDLNIANVCRQKNVNFYSFDDALLVAPEAVTKKDGGVYTIFTPFYNKVKSLSISKPQKNNFKNFSNGKYSSDGEKILSRLLSFESSEPSLLGGRTLALSILKNINRFHKHDEQRNFPSIDGTTGLSAHNKFGTVSIREVYYALKDIFGVDHSLIRELFWRDFFTHIGFHHAYVLGQAFNKKYENIQWENNKQKFKAWCEGRTGFPIVDAGMRELNATGFMHNRVRMIVASFLVKDLHIDWRLGEKYFAQQLLDYDPFINNGNWQWAASTGCDAQPYFRIFNPWLQQQKYDPQCVYIKKWVKELADVAPKEIHRLSLGNLFAPQYPQPLVNHSQASAHAKVLFKRVLG